MATTGTAAKNAGRKATKPAKKSAEPLARSDVPAVEKAFDILELLSSAPQGLTMNEIASTLDRTMGEIYRIAIYMNNRGYITQDPESSRYSLTLRLFEVAHQNVPTNRLIRYAVPILEALALQCEQSCHLGVLYESSVLILASAPSPRPASYSVRTGAIFPLLSTSSGMVILAHMKPDARERVIASLSPEDQESTHQRVGKIARKGFDRRNSGMVNGVLNLSAPVFDHGGVVGALTLAYLDQVSQKMAPDTALEMVLSSTKELSRRLGYQPEAG